MKALFALLVLTVGTTSLAQNEFAREACTLSGGSFVGANFSSASIDPSITTGGGTQSGRTDILAGVMGQLQISRSVAVRGELGYTQYGYNFEHTQTNFSSKEYIKVNYLEVAILALYQITAGSFAPYFFGGMFGGPRFCAGGNYEQTSLGVNQSGEFDIRETTSAFQFGVLGGAGAEYKLNRGFSFFVDARYQLGLNNIYRRPSNVQAASLLPDPTIKYRAFNVRGGILVDL